MYSRLILDLCTHRSLFMHSIPTHVDAQAARTHAAPTHASRTQAAIMRTHAHLSRTIRIEEEEEEEPSGA
jgi:hypothetical protein